MKATNSKTTRLYISICAALLAAVASISMHASEIDDEAVIAECTPYIAGLPSLSSARYGLKRTLDFANRGESEEYLRRITKYIQEKNMRLEEWLGVYSLAVVAYLEGNQDQFLQALTLLETSSTINQPLDIFNRNIATAEAGTLLSLYAETDVDISDLNRMEHARLAMEIVEHQKLSPDANKLDERKHRALNMVRSKLGSATGNLALVELAISDLEIEVEREARPNEQKGLTEQINSARVIDLARAKYIKAEMTGELDDYVEASDTLEQLTSYAVDKCNAYLIGRASYIQALTQYRLAKRAKEASLGREYLASSLNNVQVARRLLEKLHYPTLWRDAHRLTADIYESLELTASDNDTKEGFRELKQRSLILSQT